MTAMLGMYDMPALQPANDRFWSLIRRHLGYGPERLTRDRDFWQIWLDEDLVFAQTCGMPYRTHLHGSVQLAGTPDYGLTGCDSGYYCSVLVARADDQRDLEELSKGVFAYNEALSQSGWAAAITFLSGLGLAPFNLMETGGHAHSANAVADGRADLAALDALTWELLKDHSGFAGKLREVAKTDPTPALPYITGLHQDRDAVASAVRAAIRDLSLQDRNLLRIKGLVDIPAAKYLEVPTPPTPQALQAST